MRPSARGRVRSATQRDSDRRSNHSPQILTFEGRVRRARGSALSNKSRRKSASFQEAAIWRGEACAPCALPACARCDRSNQYAQAATAETRKLAVQSTPHGFEEKDGISQETGD